MRIWKLVEIYEKSFYKLRAICTVFSVVILLQQHWPHYSILVLTLLAHCLFMSIPSNYLSSCVHSFHSFIVYLSRCFEIFVNVHKKDIIVLSKNLNVKKDKKKLMLLPFTVQIFFCFKF